ncbi:MAG: hypothetical protein KBT39_05285 [Bacteroidales bacterium]|nr:hypothetical protein [Bacteroidales bacterium]
MKKLLLSFAAMMLAFVANAKTEVTLDFSDASAFGIANPAANGEYTQVENGGVITKDGITITVNYSEGNGVRFFRSNPQDGSDGVINLRIYKPATITIAAAGTDKITAITINGTNLNSTYMTGDGYNNGAWTGNASSVTLNCIKSTVQMNSMTIELNGDASEQVHIANTPETAYTVSEANAIIKAGKALNEEVYVKGTVASIEEISLDYGNANYTITDGAEKLIVYHGFGLKGAKFTSEDEFEDGDDVVVCGLLTDYNGTYEFTSGSKMYSLNGKTEKEIDPVVATHITIAEFLSKADTETAYEVTGQVMSIANDKYGNLTIKEGESELYLYGVLDKDGASQNFASLGVKAGDMLTVVGKYSTHNDEPQMKDAQYIKHEAGELPPYVAEGEGTQENPYTINDVKGLYGTPACPTDPVWVAGTIIGTAASGSKLHAGDEADANVASNIAVADEEGNWIPVELPGKSDARANLNLIDNPENLGKEVAVLGTITAYFSVAGVKGVTEFEIEKEPELADATELSGTYTLYGQNVVEEIPGWGAVMGYEQKTITVAGTAEGTVTVTGLTEEPLTGVFVADEDMAAVIFDADPYIVDAEVPELPAMAAYTNGVLYFENGIASVSQNATAIKEGVTITEIGGTNVDLYTMEFNYVNGQTMEEGTFTCPVYLGFDGEDVMITNFLGITCFDATAEDGGFVIEAAMSEDGSPIMFDMASEDGGLHFVKDADTNTYKYEAAALGYCSLNMQYYIVSINLKKDLTGIAGVSSDKAAQNMLFNLAGQRVNANQKGIVIKNGKKVMK